MKSSYSLREYDILLTEELIVPPAFSKIELAVLGIFCAAGGLPFMIVGGVLAAPFLYLKHRRFERELDQDVLEHDIKALQEDYICKRQQNNLLSAIKNIPKSMKAKLVNLN